MSTRIEAHGGHFFKYAIFVLVTHEPDIAAYADRIVVFRDGKIKRDDPVVAPRDAAEEFKNLPPIEPDED